MLKTIFLVISVILIAVNLVMLWQIFHKMKYNPDKELKTLEPYIAKRLTVFAVNMVILSLIGLVQALLRAF
ncbi:MAG: hypothetical protein IKK72_04000 [Oscillospiraceae bacterium]|nr:hypothetical protein [Oscillospiraceae bacterium]